jgi:RNA recognition motif-containing protein
MIRKIPRWGGAIENSPKRGEGGSESMAKKLFVGGLSWGITDAELQKAFEPFGEIKEAKVITDRDTGRSRGFGFVTFTRDEDAATAISKMHGTNLDGRTIAVNEAQEKSPREGGRGGGRNRY